MARANLRDTKVRAALETVAVEQAVVHDAIPFISLRITQAIQRTGLTSLLEPALDELEQISKAMDTAQAQVSSALSALTEKE